MDRAELRSSMLVRRAALATPEQARASAAVSTRALSLLQSARRVAVYRAVRGEIDPLGVAQAVLARGGLVYLPVLLEPRLLAFARWREGDQLQRAAFGLEEPRASARRIQSTRLDAVIVPVVAFDRHGTRLGHGAGYYDHTFAYRRRSRSTRPTLIGVAYAFQQCDFIDRAPWDVPLDYIVTDREVVAVNQSIAKTAPSAATNQAGS